MPDIYASGSGWPSVTSALVTVKLGTTGKRANGSFIVCPPPRALWYKVIIDPRERDDQPGRSAQVIQRDRDHLHCGVDDLWETAGDLLAGRGA